MSFIDSIYSKFPLFLQNSIISTYGLYWHWLRFGGLYHPAEAGYRQRDRLNGEQWQEYQQRKLRDLLILASTRVPYYRHAWTKSQTQAALNGKLSALPLLKKDAVRNNPMDFVCEDKRAALYWTFHTSGSTGTPIASLWTAKEIRDSLAVREVRSAGWAGVSFKLPRATFSGRMVEPDPESKGPFYRFNAAENQVYFSPFHLRADNAHYYVDAIKKHHIQWMTGYAVSYYLLAKFILELGLEVPPLKAVITTSEKLTYDMRSTMERAYHCRIFEEYSTVENVLFASECEYGHLHVSPDIGIVEILRPDGTECAPGEEGEVVTTCLFRSYQPMIRYRLGDVAAWGGEPCPCGRSMPIIKEVTGRVEDVVIGPDGRQMVRFHSVFTNQPHIREGQVIQEKIDVIRVRIVPTKDYSADDSREVAHRIHQRLGNKVNVEIELVDSIPRTKSGKFQAVISNINPGSTP